MICDYTKTANIIHLKRAETPISKGYNVFGPPCISSVQNVGA